MTTPSKPPRKPRGKSDRKPRQILSIRLDPDVLDRARRAAEADNRTLTNYIETSLVNDPRLRAYARDFSPERMADDAPVSVFSPQLPEERFIARPSELLSPADNALLQRFADMLTGHEARE